MRIAPLLLILVATQAVKFLEEPQIFIEETETALPYAPIFAQDSPLFTEDQLAQNIETATATPPELDYDAENQSSLESAEAQQMLIAKQYEQNLAPSGDCIILYSECDFKGASAKVCNQPNQAMSFALPIYSVYVPLGQQFTMIDSVEGNSVAYLMSEKCLLQPIQMENTEQDVLVSSDSQSWIGADVIEAAASIPMPEGGNVDPVAIQYEDADGNVITKEQVEAKIYADAAQEVDMENNPEKYDQATEAAVETQPEQTAQVSEESQATTQAAEETQAKPEATEETQAKPQATEESQAEPVGVSGPEAQVEPLTGQEETQ